MIDLNNGFTDIPIGPIPEDWEVCKLGNLLELRREFIHPRDVPGSAM
jgi:hypothetical protein